MPLLKTKTFVYKTKTFVKNEKKRGTNPLFLTHKLEEKKQIFLLCLLKDKIKETNFFICEQSAY